MTDLREECRQHFNEPVLLGGRLARLIGYAEDDMDVYLICLTMGGEVVWHTGVGGYVFLDCLKGRGIAGPYDDLTRLDSLLSHNGAAPAEHFVDQAADAF